MNSSQISCFMEAARRLNFTEASVALHISQPALSRNIATLEEELGFELFSRSNKHKETRLTPAGVVMFEGFGNLSTQYNSILDRARNVHEGKSGDLTIGLIETDRIDPNILKITTHFSEQFPNVELNFRRGSYGELRNWLHDGTIDVAFTLKIDLSTDKDILVEDIYQIQSILYLNKSHRLAGEERLSLVDFKDEVFLSIASLDSPVLHDMLTEECKKAGFVPKTKDVQDAKNQSLLLESGKGVAIGSKNNVVLMAPHISYVDLKELRPLTVSLAWDRSNYNPSIALFLSSYELIK